MRGVLRVVPFVVAVLVAGQAFAQSTPVAAADEERAFDLRNKPWKGDFQQMLDRKVIRVLVPYSRSLYFVDKGVERGITVETIRDFERYINRKYVKDKRPVTVFVIPTTRDKLLPQLNAGIGDIAAGNLTVTETRLKAVDFVAPEDYRPVHEVIVTGPKAPELRTLDDLSGQTISVRPTTSHYESVEALNRRFAAAKRPPARIEKLPVALEDEDKLEMLNAGLLGIVVVDDWKAEMWAQVLPNIKVRDDLVLRDDGRSGWAIRKGSPGLHEAIMDFYREHLVKQGVANYRFAQYMKRIKQVQDPTSTAEWKRFEQTLAIFEEYGDKYDFDPLMLAAYNAGPGRIQQMRKLAVEQGYDPDVWFNNVEIVTAEKVGIETTTYVRNIYKYYVSYKLAEEHAAAARRAVESVAPKKP